MSNVAKLQERLLKAKMKFSASTNLRNRRNLMRALAHIMGILVHNLEAKDKNLITRNVFPRNNSS